MVKSKTIINCIAVIIYIDNPRKVVHKLLELRRECNMSDKEVDIKKSVVFLFTQ